METSHHLSSHQMDILSDLVQYISCDDAQSFPMPSAGSEAYFKMRFEAAEARYNRMKALVCASLEKQAQLQIECEGLRISAMVGILGIEGTNSTTVMLNALDALKAARAEIAKLTEMNRCLRHNVQMVMPEELVVKDCKTAESDLRIARQQISALELELVRMGDQQFEVEERLREYQDVIDNLLGQEHIAGDPVHPRFHPVCVCASAACRNYTNRLRNGLRQAVADAYVRDRNVRIHGYYQTVVRPLEVRCEEKDRRINELLLRLARLECATLRSADDVAAVDEAKAEAVCACERLKAEADAISAEIGTLQKNRASLVSELGGLQMDIQDARDDLDGMVEKRNLCKAEAYCLDKERERANVAWERVQSFLNGQMGVEYDRMLKDYQALQHQIEVAQQEIEENKKEENVDEMEQDDAPVRKVGKAVFITCRCGQGVPADDIGSHIIKVHCAKEGDKIIPCPEGCGFFATESKDMVEHIRGTECADRMRTIKRLKESAKGV